MPTVVITGSTTGIGHALAHEFMTRGYSAVITSRNAKDAADTAKSLSDETGAKAIGVACDITDKASVQALWTAANASFGHVDIWINNAGYAATTSTFECINDDDIDAMLKTNVRGTTNACKVALAGFAMQEGPAKMFNMLGGSYKGPLVPNMAIYSSTKAYIHKLTQYLVKENRLPGVVIGTLSPGIIFTPNMKNQLMRLSENERAKQRRTLNIIGDHAETVAPYLVDKMIAADKPGTHIQWMSGMKIGMRFMMAKKHLKQDKAARYGI